MSKELSNGTILLMVSTAIFFDVLQIAFALIAMDWVVGIFGFLTFFIWFKINGVSFLTPKRAIAMSGSAIIEAFPFLSSLPTWTLAVIIIAMDTKAKQIAKKTMGNTEDNKENKA